MSARVRVDDAAAYLLHTHPFSESSLILEIFARDYGRLALLARGARRPRSQLRGVLLAFQPLRLSWFGGGEVKTLARAEWQGGLPFLTGRALLIGYYLNELILRLLPREDAHPALFDAYAATLAQVAGAPAIVDVAPELRRFEKTLLGEIGYAPRLVEDVDGQPIAAERLYCYQPERGAIPAEAGMPGVTIRGSTLLALAEDRLQGGRELAEAKQLMRVLIQHLLGGQPLRTRRVFIELQDL